MISWIQTTFQRHFKWLFLILLAFIIVSFVFITNASSGLGDATARKLPPRPFFGLNLSQAEDARQLMEDAQLSLFLRQPAMAQSPSPSEIEQYALQRHTRLHLAAQLGLASPAPDSPEVADYIRTLGRFIGADGIFDPKAYAAFIDSLKTNPRLNEAEVARVILDDVRAQAYEKLLAGPGYVLPSDLAEQLARRDTRWTLAVATLDGKSFAPRIDTSDTALQTWFEANARRYEIGPRVSVAAISIPALKFADQISLTDAEIRAAYDANPSRYPAPAGTATPPLKLDAAGQDKDADASFAAVRGLVEADLRKQRAEKAALTAADDLAVKLHEESVALDRLASYLSAKGLALEDIGLVGQGAIPSMLGGPSAAAKILPEVLRLSSDRPYSNPVATPAGAAVLVWRETIDSRIPALSEVRTLALADYNTAEKRRLFNEAGRQLRATVAASLASGKSFADAVTAAATTAGLKADIKTPAAFDLTQPPQDLDFTVYQALTSLEEGKVSEFLPGRDESASLVHALKKEVPAFDPASPAALEIKAQMAPALAGRNSQGLLDELIEVELEKSAPATE